MRFYKMFNGQEIRSANNIDIFLHTYKLSVRKCYF